MAQYTADSKTSSPSTELNTPLSPQHFSPVQFLIGTYDTAIEACGENNLDEAQSSILDLMLALELPHNRSSSRLFHLFEFCLARLRDRDFQETKAVLEIIKDAWLKYADFDRSPAGRA